MVIVDGASLMMIGGRTTQPCWDSDVKESAIFF